MAYQYNDYHQNSYHQSSWDHQQNQDYHNRSYDDPDGHYSQDQGEESLEGGAGNMAGFGARRFAQHQQRQVELQREREWKQRQYQEDMMRYEEERVRYQEREDGERRRWEEEQLMYREEEEERKRWEEHQAWSRQREEEEYRCMHEDARARARAAVPSSSPFHQPQPHDYFSSRKNDAREGQTSQHSVTSPYLRNDYGHDSASTMQPSHVYEEFERPGGVPRARQQEPHLDAEASRYARETFYEDEFEEPDGRGAWDGAIDNSRYTHYGSAGKKTGEEEEEDVTINGSARSNGTRSAATSVAKSLVRNTTFEPMPKAKCADCGECIPFEELIDHVCADTGRLTPFVGLSGPEAGSRVGTPHAQSPGASPTATAPRTPFFEKYEHVVDKVTGRSSPAFVTNSRSATMEDGQRLGTKDDARPEAKRSNTSPMLSPLDVEVADDGEKEKARLAMKRQIEAQREAKRNGGAPPAGKAAVATLKLTTKGLDTSNSSPISSENFSRLSPRSAEPLSGSPLSSKENGTVLLPKQSGHRAQNSSLSSTMSSAQSSLLDGSSPRQPDGLLLRTGGSRSPNSAALTPSSSFDVLSEDEKGPKSTEITSRNELGHRMEAGGANFSSVIRADKVAGTSGKQSSPTKAKRPEVDLGRIEDLLQDLQTSPPAKPLKRNKERVDGKAGLRIQVDGVKSKTNGGPKSAPVSGPSPIRSTDRGKSSEDDVLLDIASHQASVAKEVERERQRRRAKQQLLQQNQQDKKKSDQKLTPHSKVKKAGSSRSTKLCSVCLCKLTPDVPRVERDGKLLCKEDYAELYLAKCRKCTRPVEKNAVKSSDGALKGIFHRNCFSCFRCNARFHDGIFYVFENAPYCAKHYHALNGTLCVSCNQGIEGQCRQTEGGERFHPRCLTCQYDADDGEFCYDILEDDFYVIDGKRLCEWHAQKVQKAMERKGKKQINPKKRRTILKAVK